MRRRGDFAEPQVNKVVFVSITPLIPFIERYLRIRQVLESGCPTEYWDLSPIYAAGRVFPGEVERNYVRRIDSFAALKERVKRESRVQTVFVLQVNYEWSTLSLYRLMARFGCKTAFFPWITHSARRSLLRQVADRLRLAKVWRAALNVIARGIRRAGLIKRHDLIFAAGQLTRDAYEHHRVVDINYVDYDHYLSCSQSGERTDHDAYCVFIDEGCVANPNIKFFRLEEMDPANFYRALRRFFDHVENTLGIRVIVATHPGICYDRGVFGDRAVYEGRTCELVRDAALVFSQSSTATSFAVFYRKPIVFVYTDEYALVRRESFRTMEFLSQELGAPSLNIDLSKRLEPIEIPAVRSELYDRYKHTSFTSEQTRSERSDEIIVKSLAAL